MDWSAKGPLHAPTEHTPDRDPGEAPLEDEALHREQRLLVDALLTAEGPAFAKTRFRESGLADSEWATDRWDDAMLATAMAIARKWD